MTCVHELILLAEAIFPVLSRQSARSSANAVAQAAMTITKQYDSRADTSPPPLRRDPDSRSPVCVMVEVASAYHMQGHLKPGPSRRGNLGHAPAGRYRTRSHNGS